MTVHANEAEKPDGLARFKDKTFIVALMITLSCLGMVLAAFWFGLEWANRWQK